MGFPAAPVAPIDPADPIAPIEPVDPIETIEPLDPIEAIDPAEPMLAIDPTISVALVAHIEFMIFGALIVFFLIVEPHGLARLWNLAKEKLRLWPFPY